MARALWKGAITFGLVHIPVELYPAEERKEFKFSMLDKRDFSPVGYKRYSKKSGKEVEWENIVKATSTKGSVRVLSDDDFRARTSRRRKRSTSRLSFRRVKSRPSISIAYYLVRRSVAKGHALLRETLRSTAALPSRKSSYAPHSTSPWSCRWARF